MSGRVIIDPVGVGDVEPTTTVRSLSQVASPFSLAATS